MRFQALIVFCVAACVRTAEQPIVQTTTDPAATKTSVEPVVVVKESAQKPAWHGVVVLKTHRKLGFFLSTYDHTTNEHVINSDQVVIDVLGEERRGGLMVFQVPATFRSVIQYISVTRQGVINGYAKIGICAFKVEGLVIPWEPENGELEGELFVLGDKGVGYNLVFAHCPNFLEAGKVVEVKRP